MIKKSIVKTLILWLCVASILSIIVFEVLRFSNRKVNATATAQLGTLYMSEMMLQLQDHFATIVDIKNKEVAHIAEHSNFDTSSDYRSILRSTVKSMDFEYLALYNQAGAYEIILGEDAWYRDLTGFIDSIIADENSASTAYLTSTGDKYIVFGVPATYEMTSGTTSDVMLAGFHVDKLYEYINLDGLKQLGSNAYMSIILTNGSYVLKDKNITETSFYDRISNFGGFVGMDWDEGVNYIETAMAQGNKFSSTVMLNDTLLHVYGASAGEPNDWYFLICMPEGASDDILNYQNTATTHAFMLASIVIALLFLCVFLAYMRLSMRQLKETEHARKEAEKARAEAETANKAKSIFLSNMSHDIRTPMNAIVGFTAIVEDSLVSDNKSKALDALGKMKRSSDHLRNLISDVLDMSKIESGSLQLSPEPMSIKKITDTVSAITNAHTATNNQHFDVNMHDILQDAVMCDQTRLNQILINLLGNAMKFTPENGTIRFEIWQEPSEKGADYVRTLFVIEDNGIGMSPEFAKTMFESFTREDSKVRKIEGTGLGLTITKSLLDMMGGTITAESTEGVGSKFLVTIDLEKADYTEFEDELAIKQINADGIHILVAEDNDFNYDIAEVVLSGNGFTTDRAENGQVVVDKYCSAPAKWDLILMDLRMPILDGYMATQKIREFESTYPGNLHIPILALSADVFAEDISRCYDVGMEGHISKPIDIKELIRVLHKHMDLEK